LNPLYAEAYYGRALSYYVQQNYQSVISDTTEAIKVNPSYAEAYMLRGYSYYAGGIDNAKARQDLQTYINLVGKANAEPYAVNLLAQFENAAG
jgi:tetratricopeptide (TPR) repeat protein